MAFSSDGSAQPSRILVVEDHARLARNMAFLLTVAGYEVTTATDGLRALDALQSQPPDLILSDIDMPNMSGYDLLQTIRSDRRWQHLPFIFVSDKYHYDDLMRGLDMGASDYVPKPFSGDELLLAIQRTLFDTQYLRDHYKRKRSA
jgi:DNA-binding response OmpR family regulator